MANPAQQSFAPPLPHRDQENSPPPAAGGGLTRTLPRPPALPFLPSLPALLGRPAARWARGGLIAVNVAAVTFFLLSYSRHGVSFGPYRIDLDVYRIGSAAWLHGGNLYGVLPRTSSGARLPFSYPPIAAILLAPLALVPMPAAVTALTLATVALTALVLRVFLRSLAATPIGSSMPIAPGPSASGPIPPPHLPRVPRVGHGRGVSRSGAARRQDRGWLCTRGCSQLSTIVSGWAVLWLLPVTLLLEPVRNTLGYGQVNVALMALVAGDCLLPAPRWRRGALVGIAAAVKLTPAGFVLFFLLRRDWRAAGLAAVSFCACAGIGFLLAWHDSVEYWTSVIFQAGRPGSPAYAANQSIQGVLARAGLNPHSPAGAVTWLLLSAVVVGLACGGMRRALAASADAWALSLNALACLLVSPISWSHHWVWGETAVLTLAILSVRDLLPRRLGLAVAAVGAVMFAVSPQWWLPNGGNRELHWAAWEQAAGSSYVIFATAVLIAAACWPRQRPGQRPSALARPSGERQPGAGLLVGGGVDG